MGIELLSVSRVFNIQLGVGLSRQVGDEMAIYALTPHGVELGRSIGREFKARLFAPRDLAGPDDIGFDSLRQTVSEAFHAYESHVFITAAGIAVRMIAPFLESKLHDPAVVVMDQEGRFAVSLVSGHVGGANELALELERKIGARAVITTATDSAGLPAIDVIARNRNMHMANPELVKSVSGAIMAGREVQVYDPHGFMNADLDGHPLFVPTDSDDWDSEKPGVWVDFSDDSEPDGCLCLYPRCLVVGVGCRRGVSAKDILNHIKQIFENQVLSMQSLSCLASIDAKRDEEGLLQVAGALGVEIKFYPASELGGVDVPNPSETVQKHMGVPGVCEAAAILASQDKILMVQKKAGTNVTVAVAR